MLVFWKRVAMYVRERRQLLWTVRAGAFLSATVWYFVPLQPSDKSEIQPKLIVFSLGFLLITLYLSEQVLRTPRRYRYLPQPLSPAHNAAILTCFAVAGSLFLLGSLLFPMLAQE